MHSSFKDTAKRPDGGIGTWPQSFSSERRTAPKDRIDLYAMCLNEEKMIPYFLEHYRNVADRIFIYDNGSTDGSIDLFSSESNVVVRSFRTEGDSFVDTARTLLDRVWKESRGHADWVIIVEVDEHLWHPDLRGYLAACRAAGVTAIQTIGFQMVSVDFPDGKGRLCDQITRGVPQPEFNKMAIFQPQALDETNYGVGRHTAAPTGRVVPDAHRQVRLLHFKNIGVDYVCSRNSALAPGLRARDIRQGWGAQYLHDRATVAMRIRHMSFEARRVPGLPARHALDLTMNDERDAILASGLFSADEYLASNPDVAAAGVHPIWHFSVYGWREGRRPNRHFDPYWYLARYADCVAQDVNPLLDYILVGEAAERCPSAAIDIAAYRHASGLPRGIPPLRHLLRAERARSGLSVVA